MQPYRSKRVHDKNCLQCATRRSPGHMQCQHGTCDELAEVQYRRHATVEEYAALPEPLKPIDGVAHQTVFVCFDHEPDPICDHTVAEAVPAVPIACPSCSAGPGQPCRKANGAPRSAPHSDRGPASAAPIGTCAHAHREDCEGQGSCVCTADDLVPDRPRRVLLPAEVNDAVPFATP